MIATRYSCPTCKVRLPQGSAICPECGEDLAPYLHRRAHPQVLYAEGLRLAQSGETERAIAALHQALDLDPTLADAWVVLGKLQVRQNRRAAAREAWAHALDVVPDHSEAGSCLGKLEELERSEAAAATQADATRAAAVSRAARAKRIRSLVQPIGAFLVGAVGLFAVQHWASPTPAATALGLPAPTTSDRAIGRSGPPAQSGAASTAAPMSQPTVTEVLPQEPSAVEALGPPVVLADAPDLRDPIRQALASVPQLARANIEVEQQGMVVHLVGETPTLRLRWLAESTARSVASEATIDLGRLRLMPVHEVQSGETLWSIASELYTTPDRWTAIAAANDLRAPFVIRTGQLLTLPAG